MPANLHPSTAAVVDAGLVRIAELGKQFLYLRSNYQPTTKVVRSIIDLRQKLEALALSTSAIEQDMLKSYVQEVYGLFAIYTDPMLRAVLPPVSAAGNKLVPLVLSVNGSNLVVNGSYIRRGYILVPNDISPVYTEPLAPGQTYAAYTYNGMAGTQFSFNPVTAAAAQPFTAFLWVSGQQVGRIDYPLTAAGTGFSLRYNGTLYYGSFPAITNQTVNL
jgi:hypothetical protein